MNQSEPTPNRKFKRYDLNFKRSAVELWLGGGQSAQAVADELSISVQALKTCESKVAVSPLASGAQTVEALQMESCRLRRELQFALRQREIN